MVYNTQLNRNKAHVTEITAANSLWQLKSKDFFKRTVQKINSNFSRLYPRIKYLTINKCDTRCSHVNPGYLQDFISLCYRNKHLPCIFIFQHTHPKNWFFSERDGCVER